MFVKRVFVLALAAGLTVAPLGVTAADPYEVNAILPLTGGASFLGKSEAEALKVLETTVNKSGGLFAGRPIKFVIADDQSSPQVGVQLLNGVIAKKVPVVLGSSLVAICNAMVPLVEKNGPLMYCFSPGIHPADGSYAFSSSISTTDLLEASAVYFGARGWKKIGIITSTDASGQDAERVIDAAFGSAGKHGESIVAREHFNTTDLSVAAQMSRIKASGAQALIAWSTGTPVATLLRGVQEAGLDIPVETGNGNLTYAQMKAYAGFMPKELYFAGVPAVAPDQLPRGPVKNTVDAYLGDFKAVGVRPDIGQSLAWDPAVLVVNALKKAGPNATGEQLKDAIAAIKNWAGINGTYDFKAVPQRGVGVNSVVMVRWDPAKETWTGVSRLGGMPIK